MAALLYSLAGKLAGELCSPLLKDYVGKPWELGTKSEFEKLKSTVSAIEAILLDAEEKERTNHQVRDWLKKLKLVFYDLEDLLQEVRTEALKRRVKTKNKRAKKVLVFFSGSNQLKYRIEMGRKVKLIIERMDAIASDSNRFNFVQRHEEKSVRNHRREETHSFVPIDKFIGRDADKKYVTRLLFQFVGLDNISVISIVGLGGMGKTTLAQSIYNSDKVKCKFDIRIWVCVSEPFNIKLICENIITSATHVVCRGLPMDVVKDKLKRSIDGRKYLLVLDDVWNESSVEWGKLEVLLSGGAKGSKILITTRAELVARAANSIATHVLKGLSHEDSWALFQQVAFKRGVKQVSATIVGIGKEVVEKCAGVPLVVKAIGSILSLKETELDWFDFKKNDLPRVTQNSEGTVLPVLRLSYDYLSTPLKRCFVYCAIYPKDFIIMKDELIGMWIAHGLIQLDDTTRSLEDVGERHFKDLVDRSLFEVHGRDTYKMHDLIHDLAQSVGGDEYYNPGSGANSIDILTRHAWVSGDELANICQVEKLRTLVLIKSRDEIITAFEQLRVLRLTCLSLPRVLQFVGGLRNLNYLNLSYNNFDSLPESICSLYNLQTLILSHSFNLKELPMRTRDLVSLKRLDVSHCEKLRHMPRGLEELTCLQTLTEFVTGGSLGEGKRNCAKLCELKSLVNLRGSLAIKKLGGSKSAKLEGNKSCVLMELKFIKQLELLWRSNVLHWKVTEHEESEELLLFETLKPHPNLEELRITWYPFDKFPSWMDPVNIGITLPNIVKIKLEDCESWRHLPALGLLPSLQQLHLRRMGSVEYLIDSPSSTMEEPKQLFPSLKELYLHDMPKLKRFFQPAAASRIATTTNNNRYFPVFDKVDIHDCPLFLDDGSDEEGKIFLSLREVCVSGDVGFYSGGIEKEVLAWLRYLPHLQILKLSSIRGLISLPEWMGNLTSLQKIYLHRLKYLASIPDFMQRLTSMELLLIRECPKLVRRCKKETGADWHNIAHIPKIEVTGSIW